MMIQPVVSLDVCLPILSKLLDVFEYVKYVDELEEGTWDHKVNGSSNHI